MASVILVYIHHFFVNFNERKLDSYRHPLKIFFLNKLDETRGLSKTLSNICDESFVKRDHSFSMYAKFTGKLLFLTLDRHTCVCVSLSGKFAYVVNE